MLVNLLKTLREQEKLLVMSTFSFSHSVFYPFCPLSTILIKFKICRLQTLSVWKSLKFVVLVKGCLFYQTVKYLDSPILKTNADDII